MVKRIINKIDKIVGENIFVFQYTDSSGKSFEERKSLDDFLLSHPLVVEKEKRIKNLESNNSLLIENKGLLDEKVLRQSQAITALKNEKERIKQELENFIKQIEGKDLSDNSDLYQEAFKLFMDGGIDEALSILDDTKMFDDEKKLIEGIEQKAETRLLKARLLRVKYQYKVAEKNYLRALELLPNEYISLELANFYYFLRQNEKAKKYYKECLLTISNQEEKAVILNNLGVLLNEENNLLEAEKYFSEAIDIRKKLIKLESAKTLPLLVGLLNNMATLYKKRSEFDEAENYYKEALGCLENVSLERKFSDTYYLNAMISGNLANLLKEKGELENAYELYRKSISIYRKIDLPEALARNLTNYGNLQRILKQYKKAEISYSDALKIREGLVKNNPQTYLPTIVLTLINLSALQKDMNKIDEAEENYFKAHQICEELIEIDFLQYAPLLSKLLSDLANLQEEKLEYDIAEENYNEALKIMRRLMKINSKVFKYELSDILNNLGILYLKLKNHEKADSCYKEAYNIRKELSDLYPEYYLPSLAITLANIANLQNDAGLADEAEKNYDEVISIYNKMGGSLNLAYKDKLALVYNNAAINQLSKETYQEAENYYNLSLSLYRELVQINEQGYLAKQGNTLLNLAIFYQNSIPNKERSIKYVKEAFLSFFPFREIPIYQELLEKIYLVIEDWEIELESFLADVLGGDSFTFLN